MKEIELKDFSIISYIGVFCIGVFLGVLSGIEFGLDSAAQLGTVLGGSGALIGAFVAYSAADKWKEKLTFEQKTKLKKSMLYRCTSTLRILMDRLILSTKKLIGSQENIRTMFWLRTT
ncbi:hypothetical protein WN093_00470 [Gammaproteobacteria bacterium AS21]